MPPPPSSAMVFMVCFLGIIMLEGVHASVRRYRFEVTNSSLTRLCNKKSMLMVNGRSPGTTIYARKGDLVVVDVINNANHNITIHWHGVKMPRYPWSDGTEYVTQCPITPGTRFKQNVILSDEEGTLWWHAHSDWTRNSVYGAIIILPPKGEAYPFPKPHAEVPILIGEWWNVDVQQVVRGFQATGGDPQASDAMLMNGQPGDLYPCSRQDTYKLSVECGKTYLIRLVSAMMDFIVYFKITGHNVTVVGTDAAYTKPFTTDYVAISPGQTVDILLEANQAPSHYYMGARVLGFGGSYVTTPTTGIIEYTGDYYPPPSPPLPSFPDYLDSDASADFTNGLRSLANEKYPIHVPNNITKNLFLTISVNLWPCDDENPCFGPWPDRLAASFNNVSMLLPVDTIDILQAYYRGINGVYTTDFPDNPPSRFDYTQDRLPPEESRPRFRTSVSVLEYNAEVEIVFQGTILAGGIEHPFHLHGHSFFVVGSGSGNFDAARDPPNYNLVDPPLVETIAVPRNGWTAIRFKANNPGVWYMHCHFERHQSWGMETVFIVKDGKAPDEKMLPPPPDMPRCGGESPSELFSAIREKINNPQEYVNNVSMLLPRAADILDAYYRGIGGVYTTDFPDQPPSTFNYVRGEKARNESLPERKTSVMFLEYNETVEIVFQQGTSHADGFDHPMHLHGHNFYVVGSGFGNFDPARDPLGYNLVDPPLVETTVVPINGWATIRFKANNQGVWFMHCHFDRHQSWGMKLAFIVKDGKD